jgi:transposase-like protein
MADQDGGPGGPVVNAAADEASAYRELLALFHPGGLRCPKCGSGHKRVHRSTRRPVCDFRCVACGCVYNAWTGTPLQRTRRSPVQIQGVLAAIRARSSTAQLARDLGLPRPQVHVLRHRLARWLHDRTRSKLGVEPVPPPAVIRPESMSSGS